MMLEPVLKAFGISNNAIAVAPVHIGLINTTWKVETAGQEYIVQKINQHVFKNPEDISYNISLIAGHLANNHPDYFFAAPLLTPAGESIWKGEEDYFRIFPYVKNAGTKEVVKTPAEAYEAARQFGKFTAMLADFDANRLKTIIPGFHDLTGRYQQFQEALQTGNKDRLVRSRELISDLKKYTSIADEYKKIKSDPAFLTRVMHHDTKISNVLFDEEGKGICVIDLDTIMPGYFISDVGDMMRTCLCRVSEEESDLSQIEVRKEFYEAIVKGYLSEMGAVLNKKEKEYFFYAGTFMIYMQALRFLTDYLNNDRYYGSSYPGQNFTRAANQAALLKKMFSSKPQFESLQK